MPHIMTSVPGGTSWVPTSEKLDGIIYRIRELKTWINSTMIPDMFMIAEKYPNLVDMGKGAGRFVAFGVLDTADRKISSRYLPSGMTNILGDGTLSLANVDVSKITEDTTHAYYENHTPLNPLDGQTAPQWPKDGKDFENKYTWCKAPRYDGVSYEAGGIARMLAGYARGVEPIVKLVDTGLAKTGLSLGQLDSVAGRLLTRVLEADYVCDVMEQNFNELVDLVKSGEAEYFVDPKQTTGQGVGLWEAPRGALLHTETVENDVVTHYQEIIPSTWNLSPKDGKGNKGPLEEMLAGTSVTDIDQPLDAVRIVHSVDPCTACACHVTEPKTGKTFTTVTSPWGVK